MPFNHNWVDDRLPLWLPHMQPLVGVPNIVALQLGVFEGRGTCWMMDHILTHPSALCIDVDPFEPNPTFGFTEPYAKLYQANVAQYGAKVRPVKSFTQDACRELTTIFAGLGRGANLIYVDASHEAHDVLHDIMMVWQYSQAGTYIVFDDYEWGGVNGAVKLWMQVHPPVQVLHTGYQLIVQRNG